jgi:hypothetical protein
MYNAGSRVQDIASGTATAYSVLDNELFGDVLSIVGPTDD